MLHEPLHCSIFLTDLMFLISQDRIWNYLSRSHYWMQQHCWNILSDSPLDTFASRACNSLNGALRWKCYIFSPFISSVLSMTVSLKLRSKFQQNISTSFNSMTYGRFSPAIWVFWGRTTRQSSPQNRQWSMKLKLCWLERLLKCLLVREFSHCVCFL